jgi:hypothetical protein
VSPLCLLCCLGFRCSVVLLCWAAGAGHGHGHHAGVKREALAPTGVQRGSLLHLPATANHFQCRVCSYVMYSSFYAKIYSSGASFLYYWLVVLDAGG